MASQHFMAFSDRIMGLGHFQAAPFACSKVRPSRPFCNQERDVQPMLDYTVESSARGRIANVSNITGRPIFVFSGRQDSVVTSPVNQRAVELYRRFTGRVLYFEHPEAQHAFVTDIEYEGANQCSVLRSPFVNFCPDYDMAGAMFQWLYDGTLSPRVEPRLGRIFPINQASYFPAGVGGEAIGMDDTAFVYVPSGCAGTRGGNANGACSLHVTYHGCNSAAAVVGDAIYTHAGFNGWAEANNIVVLYPQAFRSNCWEWNGETIGDQNYDTRDGIQVNTVNRMVDDLDRALLQQLGGGGLLSPAVGGQGQGRGAAGDGSGLGPAMVITLLLASVVGAALYQLGYRRGIRAAGDSKYALVGGA